MSWPKGKSRPEMAGRKKGTPNRKTQALLDKCEEQGLDVWGAMVELVHQATEPMVKFSILKELAQYLYPKRKAMEISGNHTLSTTFERLDGTKETYTIGPAEEGSDE